MHFEVSAGAPATAWAAYPPFAVSTIEQVAGVEDFTITGSPELAENVSTLSELRSRFGGVVNEIDWLNFKKLIVFPMPTAGANVSSPYWDATTLHAAPAVAGIGVAATSTGPESLETIWQIFGVVVE